MGGVMNSPTFSATELSQLQRQLNSWRQRQPGRRRLPTTLWDAAAHLARLHGVSRVSQALRLDYYRLQRRANAVALAPVSRVVPASFVELRLDSPAPHHGSNGTVELFDGPQRRLRIETGPNTAAWVALAEAFWRIKP